VRRGENHATNPALSVHKVLLTKILLRQIRVPE
jgi:hypothetical protein